MASSFQNWWMLFPFKSFVWNLPKVNLNVQWSSSLALIRVWPWIKLLSCPLPIIPSHDHPVLIPSICWRCFPFIFLNLFQINSSGYPPWGALALIRVWPWIKLLHLPPSPDHPVLILSICWRCFLCIFLNLFLGMGCCWLIPQTMLDLE